MFRLQEYYGIRQTPSIFWREDDAPRLCRNSNPICLPEAKLSPRSITLALGILHQNPDTWICRHRVVSAAFTPLGSER